MARALRVSDYLNRARYLIEAEVEFCEYPPKGMSSDAVQERLTEALKLLMRTERLEDLSGHTHLRGHPAKEVLDYARKAAGAINMRQRVELGEALTDVIDDTERFRRRLDVSIWRMEIKSYGVVDAARIIDAAFSAALNCEVEYESARHETSRPSAELAGAARRPAGG